jgi:hypothetical protein
MSTFDPCPHLIKMLTINCEREIREAMGLPVEKNLTKLYEDGAAHLGMNLVETNSDMVPAPRAGAMPSAPSRECPKCKLKSDDGKYSFALQALCSSCKGAEGGKYKTRFVCSNCGYEEKSERPVTSWLTEMGVAFDNQTKQSLGVKTLTDDGVK